MVTGITLGRSKVVVNILCVCGSKLFTIGILCPYGIRVFFLISLLANRPSPEFGIVDFFILTPSVLFKCCQQRSDFLVRFLHL